MRQVAQVLVHSDPDSVLMEVILDRLAEQQGFPCKQDILGTAHGVLQVQEWTRFWRYTEAVNPFVFLRSDYEPIPSAIHT